MHNISDFIKSRTIRNSVELFSAAHFSYGVNCDFDSGKFENFINNTYSIYEYHNEIYKYEKDMGTFLGHAIATSIEKGKKRITIEDILDSIWEVKTSDTITNGSEKASSNKVISSASYKIKKIQEG